MSPGGWLARRPLRTRLTAGLLLLLLLACTVVGLATTLALRGFLLGRLDQQLTAAGSRFAVSLEHSENTAGTGTPGRDEPGEGLSDVPGQSVGTLGVHLVGGTIAQAAIVHGDGDHDQDDTASLTRADRSALARTPPDGTSRTLHLDALGDYRVRAVPGRDDDVQLTGLPLRPVHDTLERLEVVEAVVFAVVLLVTGLTGATFVRLSLRPLHRVAATATAVSELPLASGQIALPDRVPPQNPGTEVGQLGAAFNQLLDHVEASLAARHATEDRLRRFVADASHELRTPLATIRSHTELARRSPGTLTDPVDHALHRVEAASTRMGTLVDDLLLLARLDAGRPLAREPVDLTRLAIDTTNDARAAAPDHRWTLDLPEESVTIRGDQYRLHQVLANLLANASTHTPAGTTVTVRVSRHTAGGQTDVQTDPVEVAVTDNGPGIPAAVLPTLFERFARGDSSRATGGTGLGLAIVAAVAHAHQGTVTVDSRPGRTTFHLLLPPGT
ncbi:HAMP domain-containing sensor histidine kinase [Segeticoccus rhizosphaerae]|uniref:HAMP domain-containing sensor histidine kinase n=1 Tax=Segeticoccus rhizosphaerae TaxID=1104777 RepID=UPI001EE4DC89|nr:HAMP domain-containing sensor histidine kinase [Ornithinicoccus soli]